MSQTNWDNRFRDLAKEVSRWSKDTSTQVGCVIVDQDHSVLSLGFNGMPRGVNDNAPDRHIRPKKYLYFAHAEENAIANAARTGVSLNGAIAYVYGLFPCAPCARMLINSGVVKIYADAPDLSRLDWADSFAATQEMLEEALVTCVMVPANG